MSGLAIIGASGRSGLALCRALLARRTSFTPVVRNMAVWDVKGLAATPRLADLQDPGPLKAALAGMSRIVSCAHARWTPAILAAAEPGATLILMGSTRRYSRWPDAHGDGVRSGEAAFLAGGHPGVMLHPTMIYGAEGENNVQRLAALMRRLPVAPLPGGGHSLVQPIHQGDVTACLLAAIQLQWTTPTIIPVAGPEAVHYRAFLAAVAAAAGLRLPPIVPIPAVLLRALAPLSRFLPGIPEVGPDEIRRLTEDKAFDITSMQEVLRVTPRSLEQGLAETFSFSG